MLRCELPGRKQAGSRGIRRPVFWLAWIWMGLLCLFYALDIPLEKASEGILYLQENGAAAGQIRGVLKDLTVNSSGHYSLHLSRALFHPEEGEALLLGEVLVYFPRHMELRPGLLLEVQGTLRLFRQADNPGEFDPRAYYAARQMYGYMEGEALRVAEARHGGLAEAAFQVKGLLRQGLERVLNPEDAALLAAMLLGERSAVPAETEALYEQAGISHLLSVSGLHVSFWALIIGKITAFFLTFFPFSRGRSFFSRRGFDLLRTLIIGLGILFYMLICGARIPIQRAGLMALLYQMARGLGLSFDLPSAWGAAVLAALIPAPYALFQASFQLSFSCVLLLGCLLPLLSRRLLLESGLGRSLLLPLTLQMGNLPLTLWHYFKFHPYAPLANLAAVPLAGLILAGGFLCALLAHLWLPAARLVAGVIQGLLAFIRLLCRLLGALPGATLLLGQPRWWQILVYMGLALLILSLSFHIRRREMENLAEAIRLSGASALRRGLLDARRTALLLWICLWAAGCVFFLPSKKELAVTSLYVGQGDCHLISTETGRHYLVDGGSSSETAGERIMLPFLEYQGIRRLEWIMVSHPDEDHINGLVTLMQAEGLHIGGLMLPAVFQDSPKAAALLTAADKAQIPLFFVRAGEGWEDGTCRFEILYPGGESQVEDNESSLVLWLSRGRFSMLFTGDLGDVGESMLLHTYGDAWETCSVLKVGHHGSDTGTTQAFLNGLQPALALISCGRNNPYGHPAPAVLARLEAAGCQVLRTDKAGAVTLYGEADGSFTYQIFHEKEMETMQKKEDKGGRFPLIASAVVLGLGILSLCLALLLPPKGAEEGTVAGGSQETWGTTAPVMGSAATRSSSSEEADSWPIAPPTSGESAVATLPAKQLEMNAGRSGPERDPQIEGYVLAPDLTDALYSLFAGDLTNNTDPEDPFRSLSADFKQELDGLAESFAAGKRSEEALLNALKGKSFVWPGDKLGLVHALGEFQVRCYVYPGRDMSLVRDRILLSNTAARHYLFLRVYYHPEQDRVRIYMVNGLIY